jgi:hypothetical protein
MFKQYTCTITLNIVIDCLHNHGPGRPETAGIKDFGGVKHMIDCAT